MIVKMEYPNKDKCAPYGTYVNLKDYPCFTGDGWECWMTEGLCMDQAAGLRLCSTSGCENWAISEMKKSAGQTLVICPEEPIVVAVAARNDGLYPCAEDVRAFIVSPEEVFLLQPGVWYTECRGYNGPVSYCMLSADVSADEDCHKEIAGGPVEVKK